VGKVEHSDERDPGKNEHNMPMNQASMSWMQDMLFVDVSLEPSSYIPSAYPILQCLLGHSFESATVPAASLLCPINAVIRQHGPNKRLHTTSRAF
jgi:hypothetical protein